RKGIKAITKLGGSSSLKQPKLIVQVLYSSLLRPIMQFKLALVTAALTTLAVANLAQLASSTCSTGLLQCCERTETAAKVVKDQAIIELLKRAHIKTKDLTGQVGFGCSSSNGLGSGSCTAQALCCTEGNPITSGKSPYGPGNHRLAQDGLV
ncbi:hypothetical protein BDP27DRAFT_1491058, partial [Rhodocollybia butyracea]